MNSSSYPISELARQAGVSARTIRYYVNEGLLPRPETRGRYTMYDEAYLKRIQLVRRLKAMFLPLSEIRRILNDVPTGKIESELGEFENLPPAEKIIPVGEIGLASKVDLLQPEGEEIILQKRQPPSSEPLEPKMKYEKGDLWRREVLADGVELMIRQPQDDPRVTRLIRTARRLFK